MKLFGTCIQTRHAEELAAFYAKVFGEEPDVDGGVDFRFYDAQLIVYKLDGKEAAPTANAAFIYAVEDVDAEYQRLVDADIRAVAPPTDKPWGVRSFVIHDPDGNTLSFFANLR